MHKQEGPFGVQPEQRGEELLASFRLAGVGGGIKGVLNEKSFLLERRDGRGLRVDIESIHRVRHHHVPVTPPGLTWIGFITLILGARVLTGTAQLYALGIGAAIIFGWLLGRKPTLCIDTKEGDRHILHGPDSLLLRTQMMVNRLCEGKTLDEAREGLEEIQQYSNYPTISPLEALKIESNAIQENHTDAIAILPEEEKFDEADLEQALKAMYHGNSGNIPDPIPNRQTTIEADVATEAFVSDSHADNAGRGLLERARNSLHETKEEKIDLKPKENLESWSQPWEKGGETNANIFGQESNAFGGETSAYSRAWGRDEPNWYCEKQNGGTRIQSAVSEAKSEGDMFFSGSMFDENPTQTTDTGIFGNIFDSPNSFQKESEPIVQANQQPWSGQAIHNAMNQPTTNALTTTLPEPTVHALRTECTPGVVAAARRETPLDNNTEKNQPSMSNGMDDYPALEAMLGKSTGTRRFLAKPKQESRLMSMAKKGIGALIRNSNSRPIKKVSRPVKVEGDDYASTYGDDDGFADGQFREVPLRSGQILRLRADQDHQAEVGERIRELSKSSGGVIEDDEANALIERLSASGDMEPIANLLRAAENKKLAFGQLASTSPPKEKPGHHGISRLG
tara:strand:+ start:124 stop:1995 length:1872 start_codon:yes stop_codon:yes gene_type:complete